MLNILVIQMVRCQILRLAVDKVRLCTLTLLRLKRATRMNVSSPQSAFYSDWESVKHPFYSCSTSHNEQREK